MSDQPESNFQFKTNCPSCGSTDNLAVYDDGHTHCFGASCDYHTPATDGSAPATPSISKVPSDFVRGTAQALGKRKITEDICRKYGYHVGYLNGQTVQIANYRYNGEIVGQKIRTAGKDFSVRGSLKDAGFFGQHLFGQGGKMVTVVEGEIDALAAAQLMGQGRWPVVSLPQGCQSAAKVFAAQAEWLDKFDKVVIAFDMDSAGQEAAKAAAEVVSPGKAYIASLPAKDASDALMQGKGKELVDSIWQAQAYRPDGIISASDLWDQVSTVDIVESVDYPWPTMNKMTHGLRKGELVTFTSGSGMGKSSVIREIIYDLINKGRTVGALMLEESVKRSAQGIMSVHANKQFHLPDTQFELEELREAFDATCGTGRLFLYDHWGSSDIDALLAKIRFLALSCGCDYVILDHISIVVSSAESTGGLDERRLIDSLMTKLRTLVENTGIGMIIISHLKRPEGTPHEEGGRVQLGHLRSSGGIAQLSDMVIALERNQQDEETRHLTTVRVLKNRFSGSVGVCSTLKFNPQTGRISQVTADNNNLPVVEDLEDLPF